MEELKTLNLQWFIFRTWNIGVMFYQKGDYQKALKEVQDIWNFDPDKMSKRQEELLLWWLDGFMVPLAGNEFCSPNNRYYHVLTDKVTYGKHEKVMLSPYNEAFAFATFENYREKWVKQFKWQDAHPGEKIPADKDNSELNEAKWSSNKMGQTKGGWTSDGIFAYERYVEKVNAIRMEEAFKNKEQKALGLMRTANNKKAKSAVEEISSRKRRRSGAPVPPPEEPEDTFPEVIDD